MHVYNITFAVTDKRTPCSSEIRITDTNRDSAHAPKVDRCATPTAAEQRATY